MTRQTSAHQQSLPIERPLHVVTVGDSLAYGAGDEERRRIAGRLRDELRARGMTSAGTTMLGVSGAVTATGCDPRRPASCAAFLRVRRAVILGGYNPVPNHPYKALINEYLGAWDDALAARFENDPLVTVVKMSDIVTPQRLSRFDHFHPGGAAYEAAAKRIASMLVT